MADSAQSNPANDHHEKRLRDKNLKVWLVGGSAGIGLCLAEKLLQNGHELVVSSRSAESTDALINLQKNYHHQLHLLNLDVVDNESVTKAAHQAISLLKQIDLFFYNAGAYTPMQLEEWDLQQFEQINQINYLGAVRLMIALKNHFVEQGGGRWIWNVSLAADFGLPYGGAYSAPKAALLNLAESLQPELAQHNIQLQIINHGFVKTRLTAKNDFAMLGLMEPEQAADRIVKMIQTKRFETRFPWNLALILSLLKRLPKAWSLGITKKMLK